MNSTLPAPVAAALGIVPTVVDSVRRLPAKAVQLPVMAISGGLSTVDTARRRYTDLAERGERAVKRMRGTSADALNGVADQADELEDRLEELLAGSKAGKAYDKVEDALEDVTERVADTAKDVVRPLKPKAAKQEPATKAGGKPAAKRAKPAAKKATKKATQAVKKVADEAEQQVGPSPAAGNSTEPESTVAAAAALSETSDTGASLADELQAELAGSPGRTTERTAEQAAEAVAPAETEPKGEPTPSAPSQQHDKVDSAAPQANVAAAEQATEQAGSPAPLSADALPVPNYDSMTLGSLRARLRSLSVDDLVAIRTYEKAHADRLPVVTMLDNRIAKLASEAAS